jgi:hypothetical protein
MSKPEAFEVTAIVEKVNDQQIVENIECNFRLRNVQWYRQPSLSFSWHWPFIKLHHVWYITYVFEPLPDYYQPDAILLREYKKGCGLNEEET